MPAPVKSPVRAAVEAEAIAALRNAPRALSVDELYALCTVAEDKPTLSRILSHMKVAGTVIRDPDIQPGKPGGMGIKAKGARAVAAYRLPTDAELAERTARPFAQTYTPAEGEQDQAHAPTFAPPPPSVVTPAVSSAQKVNTLTAALKTKTIKTPAKRKAKPTPADVAPDSAAPTPSTPTLAETIEAISAASFAAIPDETFDDDGMHQGKTDWAYDVLALREQTRDAALAIADQLIAHHPAYAAAREAVRIAQKLADDYV